MDQQSHHHVQLKHINRHEFIDSQGPLKKVFEMVLIKRECYINDLWEFVAQETVSTRLNEREELHRAIKWLLNRLIALQIVAFSENLGMQIIPETFRTIQMPKIIIGVLKQSSEKPTILVYGNVDVEEAAMEDGWVTSPFVMAEMGNYLYGRGVALDKGPLLCWFNAIQAYRDAEMLIPINIVFLIEGMAHSGSLGLQTVLEQRVSFFREVSCVVIATRRWQGNVNPCIISGSRGLVYYHLEVECCNRLLNSCDHSGTIYEALPDLFYLLSSMVDSQLNILLEGALQNTKVMDQQLFRGTEFNYHEFGQVLDVYDLPHKAQKKSALLDNWSMPHLSIHGVDCANAENGIRFIIPNKVVGKFSISLAPEQDAEQMTHVLEQHLGQIWVKRESPNRMKLCEKLVIPPWTGQPNTPEYDAAFSAMSTTYHVGPNLVRDGGALLAASMFQKYLRKNVLVLPIAKHDSGGTPVNERISIQNYIMGSQLCAAFMWEYAIHHAERAKMIKMKDV